MPDGTPDQNEPLSASSRNLLQQQLISLSARLDRQVSQLTRLNRLSNQLLGSTEGDSVAERFAEAVVDVLDVSLGAVWVLPPLSVAVTPAFAVFGRSVDREAWELQGPMLATVLSSLGGRRATRIDEHAVSMFPGTRLATPIAARCVGRDGTCTAIVLAANTDDVGGMSEPISDESIEMLAVLAEKIAAHLDNGIDRRLIEEQLNRLRESEERLALVLRGTNDGWWDWDLRKGSCFLSSRWTRMMSGKEGPGADQAGFWGERLHPQDAEPFRLLLQRSFEGDAAGVETEVRLRKDDGEYLPVLVRGTILRGETGDPVRFAGSILDLTERRLYEDHIHRLAFYDSLTDLPNRRLLLDRLQQSLLSRARTGQHTAVLMLDVDRFKRLNDTHGHAAGDQLLRAIGRRIRELVRPYDTIARLGGDEFVVLLEQLGTDAPAAAAVAEATALKLLRALDEPYTIDSGVTHHSVSIGIAMPEGDSASADTLLKCADVALYEAKDAGRNIARFFRPEMQLRVDRRAALEARLREGFGRSELAVHYQAQVDEGGRVWGAEALMRWHAADGAAVPPSEFIPVAEESGLIHALGGWSLESACAQLRKWGPGLPEGFRVAVNLSAPEFMHPEFPERVISALARAGVHGRHLRLEITEATVVTELGFAAERMQELRAHDVEFSLDDFGSGYSSLTYLRKLPVSEVKIDYSYVRRILTDRHDAAIVRAILAMCASLNLRVVAEGVETKEQWDRLRQDGCRFFQGYLFGRPMAPASDPGHLAGATKP